MNDSPVNEEDNTAYGGEKQSGLGRFGGSWSIDEFTTHHWISVQHAPRTYPLGSSQRSATPGSAAAHPTGEL